MRLGRVEHYDDFGDSCVFWIEVKEVDSKYKKLAKAIDRENYFEDCFGICINFDGYNVEPISDLGKSELYYIDNNGERHWLEYIINKELYPEIAQLCDNEIKEELKNN